MSLQLSRRSLLLLGLSTPALYACSSIFRSALSIHSQPLPESLVESFHDIEKSTHGRLGISLLNTRNALQWGYRATERFPICSTFKVMAVAAILKQSMTEPLLLQQHIMYQDTDIKQSGYAPITKLHIADGLSVSQLCAAAIQYSDNAAVNLLMKILGGPQAVTAFAKNMGDTTFRLDRWEPALNSAIPGDLRDTSTPFAMAQSLQALLFSHILATPQRELLKNWLVGNTTGQARIRAGLPASWVVGDKTGTGDYGTTNDLAIIFPADNAAFILAIYFTQAQKDASTNDQVVASVTRALYEQIIASQPR